LVRLADAIRIARSVKPRHARTFARTVVPEVVRPARVIWNQGIGAIFLVIAVPALFKALQLYREMENDPRTTFGFGLSIIFAAVMIAFAISSFRKAKRIGSRV
jgi:dipeptide/tripeptide permease